MSSLHKSNKIKRFIKGNLFGLRMENKANITNAERMNLLRETINEKIKENIKKPKTLKELDEFSSPDRRITPVEELDRYEFIMNSYLVKTTDLNTGKSTISISDTLRNSPKNIDYILNVILEANILLNTRFEFKNRNRVYAKADFLDRALGLYRCIAFGNYDTLKTKLLNVLEQENKKCS